MFYLKDSQGINNTSYVGIFSDHDDREIYGTCTHGKKELILEWIATLTGSADHAQYVWDCYKRGVMPEPCDAELKAKQEVEDRKAQLDRIGSTERGRKSIQLVALLLGDILDKNSPEEQAKLLALQTELTGKSDINAT